MDWARFQDALFHQAPGALGTHILMVVIAVTIAVVISVPSGIIVTRPKYKKFGVVILHMLNLLQTVPGLAVVALAMPILGLGLKPAIIVLILQGLLPIARNTIAGLAGVSIDIKEAAVGMGMPAKKVLYEIELPLAMPVILAGIRTSAVYVVSVGTLAAYIGGGGLGNIILGGLSLLWPEFLLVGAGLGAMLAIALDRLLGYVESRVTPPGYEG
ncbi:ABC transporter permease [Sporomusa termitida]|uniref:Glycine betaine/carnitine/choline transport system permease protein OpuCB n=1 Tax=Sporomusa termitida TaxID=2377 RepID=A0A517DPP4_9FIRM|nr:ABC transporter permease [Sporomusa termitida]QDR79278.1 Glycine betaine/carnitine/choline transport system permease protein OpuCB [Sporomusa termitida]